MTRSRTAQLGVALIILAMCMDVPGVDAAPDRTAAQRTGSSSSSEKPKANSEGWRQISERLDKALERDRSILARFNEVMEELAVVKVRATMKRPRTRP